MIFDHPSRAKAHPCWFLCEPNGSKVHGAATFGAHIWGKR